MTGDNTTDLIQVTNIAPQVTRDQMKTLFGHFGTIKELRLYPTIRDVSCLEQSRICYVKYTESNSVPMAQHLTNTVFIDRALIVIPVPEIPDEHSALEMLNNGTIVPGLKEPEPKLPPEVFGVQEDAGVIKTYDPKLVELKLPEYPALPSVYDDRKVEETRRTIIVCNVKKEWRLDDLMDCFQSAGEVKYASWAEQENKKYGMIEFCEQASVIHALLMQGQELKGGYLSVYHSTNSIAKPEVKSDVAAQAEIEAAITIGKEAESMISAAIEPVMGMLAKERSTSRPRSHRSTSRRRSGNSGSRERLSGCSGSRERLSGRSGSRARRSVSRSRSKRSRSNHRRSTSRSMQSRPGGGKHSHSLKSHGNRSRSLNRRSTSDSHRVRCGMRSRSPERTKESRRREKSSSSRSPRSKSKRSSVKSPHKSTSTKSRSGRRKDSPLATSKSSSSRRRKHKSNSKDTEAKSGRSSADSKPRKSESIKKSDKTILNSFNNNK